MRLNQSREDYLKAILILFNKNGYVRSADVAEQLGITRPSVSKTIGSLKENGFIRLDKNKMIFLTDHGLEIAESVYEKHRFLTEKLIFIGVDPKTAETDACKIEHALSEESFEKIKSFWEAYSQYVIEKDS